MSRTVTDSAATPGRSTRARPRGPSAGRMRRAQTATARQTGTLTRKIGRQLAPARSAETRTPPRTWPNTAPADSATANRLIAWARRGPVKFSWMPVRACGNISAAPAPCTTRRPISTRMSGASPAPSEAAPNTPMPSRNSHLRWFP
jgi:hypothetical protein